MTKIGINNHIRKEQGDYFIKTICKTSRFAIVELKMP